MKLFLIHCGFYDGEVFDGVYESHVNFFVAARDFDDARAKAKLNPVFKGKKMHVDGLQQIDVIDGHRVRLEEDPAADGASVVVSHRHRDLAPKKPDASA
jgi:ribosomal protein S4E